MDDFYKQDIFFFVTTISVLIVLLIIIVASIYIFKILNDIKYIAKKAKMESNLIAEDLSELRQNIKAEGSKLKILSKFFAGLYRRRKR